MRNQADQPGKDGVAVRLRALVTNGSTFVANRAANINSQRNPFAGIGKQLTPFRTMGTRITIEPAIARAAAVKASCASIACIRAKLQPCRAA